MEITGGATSFSYSSHFCWGQWTEAQDQHPEKWVL